MIYDNDLIKKDNLKLNSDITIVGGGPAGITLAKEISEKSNYSINLIEAGGYDDVDFENHPYESINKGIDYDTYSTRLRFFGGSSNHWGGWVRPLDLIDFKNRQNKKLTGWPINYNDLLGYWEKALNICDVDTGGYGLKAFDLDLKNKFMVNENDKFKNKNFFFSPPTRFGIKYNNFFKNSKKINVFLNTTVTKINFNKNSVNSLKAVNNLGREILIDSNKYIFCAGGIENARLLMISGFQKKLPFLGRCFSDHQGATLSKLIINEQMYYQKYNDEKLNSALVMPHLSFNDDFLLNNNLNNFGAILLPEKKTDTTEKNVKSLLSLQSNKKNYQYRLLLRMENTPNFNSKITLSKFKDKFGMPKINLDWQPSINDSISMLKSYEFLKKYLINSFNTRFKPLNHEADWLRENSSYQAHHMGTTRASSDPNKGVVDNNLKIFGFKNAYVGGSSVFPTFGFSNPTLTIVALSCRLADHICK